MSLERTLAELEILKQQTKEKESEPPKPVRRSGWMRKGDAAEYLGVSPKTFEKLAPQLRRKLIGSQLWYHKLWLDEWFETDHEPQRPKKKAVKPFIVPTVPKPKTRGFIP